MRYRHLFENSQIQLRFFEGENLMRFINDHEDKNHDVFDRLKYLNPMESTHELHFVHIDNDKIVSSLALEVNPYDNDELWLKHVVVDENYRNRGLATQLYNQAVKFAKSEGKAIKRSSASDMGKKYLSHVVDRIKSDNPDVEIRDQDKY